MRPNEGISGAPRFDSKGNRSGWAARLFVDLRQWFCRFRMLRQGFHSFTGNAGPGGRLRHPGVEALLDGFVILAVGEDDRRLEDGELRDPGRWAARSTSR
jgi:hypothetical protein